MNELHPYEIDLLCVYAEVDPPFPLDIPSSGVSDAERSVVYQAARETLEARGLADESGPIGLAADFVRYLRDRVGAIDVVLSDEKTSLNAVVLVDGQRALLAVQHDGEERLVHLRELTLDRAVDALLRLIPDVEPGGSSPIMLPLRALRTAEAAIAARVESGEPFGENDLPDLLERNGVDDQVVRRMLAHLQPVLGQGQLGASRPNGQVGEDREDVRYGGELSWLDTPRGRYRVSTGGGADYQTQENGWVSANPLPREDVRGVVRRLLGGLRRDG